VESKIEETKTKPVEPKANPKV